MGGNLFQEAQRIPKDVYKGIVDLVECGRNWSYFMVPESVAEKETFGDVDIIVYAADHKEFENLVNDFLEFKVVLAPIEKDNQSWHALVEIAGYKCQFDFIKHYDRDTLEFALGYFSWNDLGNLIGRVAHRQGFKFGHDGLWWTYRDGTQLIQEIKLTNDFDQAIDFLGFESIGDEGFATFEEMFKWVERSKYFDHNAYPLEHRNHRSRVRDAKRKTYNMFLEWLSQRYDLNNYVESDPVFQERRLLDAWKRWPSALMTFEKAQVVHLEEQLFKTKFNGDIIREITHQEGKMLGLVCQRMKQMLSRDWLLKAPQEDINRAIDALFVAFRI